ncbi:hypothetical protein SDC9_93409 [bioreactor metagenome]|uniref:Uncharacterized protein n=1 Tax=bioreactor metagenome TaxID=1076179 RepID=A0A645A766_9ZZZZ
MRLCKIGTTLQRGSKQQGSVSGSLNGLGSVGQVRVAIQKCCEGQPALVIHRADGRENLLLRIGRKHSGKAVAVAGQSDQYLVNQLVGSVQAAEEPSTFRLRPSVKQFSGAPSGISKVLLIIDDKILGDAVVKGVTSHNLAAEAVEGGYGGFTKTGELACNLTIITAGKQVVMNALVHLSSRFSGKGEGENLMYLSLCFQHETQKTVTEDGRFSRPRPCTYHTVDVTMHSLKLMLIQICLALQQKVLKFAHRVANLLRQSGR